jgi:hypothetical protein
MTTSDERLLESAVERISKAMWAIGAGGAIAAFGWRGWTWGAGFALGAVASWLNFRWWKQVVDALAGARPKRRTAIFLGGRYLLLGGGAYVILHYSSISLPAALAGLLVSAAAVIVEILYELIYARRD